jgi:hypothetical protein
MRSPITLTIPHEAIEVIRRTPHGYLERRRDGVGIHHHRLCVCVRDGDRVTLGDECHAIAPEPWRDSFGGMGWKDTVLELAGDKLIDLAEVIAHAVIKKLAGPGDHDDAAKRVAKATLARAIEAAELELQNKLAAPLLSGKIAELSAKIAKDFDGIFTPQATWTPPDDVRIVCTLTTASYAKLCRIVHVDPPPADIAVSMDLVGAYAGTLITLGDADREVPPIIANILAS